MRGKSKKIATKGINVRSKPVQVDVHQQSAGKYVEYEDKDHEDFDMLNTDRDIVKEYINLKKKVEVPCQCSEMNAIWLSSSHSYYCGDCMQSTMMGWMIGSSDSSCCAA